MPRLPVTRDRNTEQSELPVELLIGEVVGNLPGSSKLRVRCSALGNRAISDVISVEGIDFHAGDRVLLAHAPSERSYIALAKVRDTKEYGPSVSKVFGKEQLTPPGNFRVWALHGLIVAEWEGWAGNSLCFHLQHNSSAAEGGASDFYTRGSHYFYPVSGAAETRYFRIRSLRYDVKEYRTYFSGWSEWASGSAVDPSYEMALFMNDIDLILDHHIVDGE